MWRLKPCFRLPSRPARRAATRTTWKTRQTWQVKTEGSVPADMSAPESDIESALTDLTKIDLESLRSLTDEILDAGMRRLLTRIDDPDNRFGGYST